MALKVSRFQRVNVQLQSREWLMKAGRDILKLDSSRERTLTQIQICYNRVIPKVSFPLLSNIQTITVRFWTADLTFHHSNSRTWSCCNFSNLAWNGSRYKQSLRLLIWCQVRPTQQLRPEELLRMQNNRHTWANLNNKWTSNKCRSKCIKTSLISRLLTRLRTRCVTACSPMVWGEWCIRVTT